MQQNKAKPPVIIQQVHPLDREELFGSAFYFALKAHESQLRKGTGMPYIEHPVRVSKLLVEMGADSDVTVAGFLHDVVEDTDKTVDDIKSLFGQRVAKFVEAVTEDKKLVWEKRKEGAIKHLNTASLDVVMLCFADKLDNIRSIHIDFRQNGDEIWKRFVRPRVSQKWYYENLMRVFKKRLNNKIDKKWLDEFEKRVGKVFELKVDK